MIFSEGFLFTYKSNKSMRSLSCLMKNNKTYTWWGRWKNKIKELVFKKTLTNKLTSLNLTEVRYMTENVKIKNEW